MPQHLPTTVLLAFAALMPAGAEPLSSTGRLECDSSLLGALDRPPISWEIRHPVQAADLAKVHSSTGALTTRHELRVRLYVVGVGRKTTPAPHRSALWANLPHSLGRTLLFDGTPHDVTGNVPVFDQVIPANTRLDLAARSYDGTTGRWGIQRSTIASEGALVVMQDGDAVPAAILRDSEAFLNAYLRFSPDGTSGATALLGPTQLLYCFELSGDSGDSIYFDQQDLVILVSLDRT